MMHTSSPSLSPFCLLAVVSVAMLGCDGDDPADAETGAGSTSSTMATTSAADGQTPPDPSAPTSAGPGGTMTSTSTPSVDGGESGSDTTPTEDDESSGEPPMLEDFSFFVTSLAGLQTLSGREDGFGGDLSYDGEIGIAGADRICETLAEMSMPGSAVKQWRAFLSTTTEDAIDRIGPGPWFDRNGRLVADDIDDLISENRPGGDPALADDMPNELGIPNSTPDGEFLDNHDTLTGSGTDGRLLLEAGGGPMGGSFSTCEDWTSTAPGQRPPAVGHSWPSMSGRNWMYVGRHANGCEPLVWLEQTGANCNGQTGVGCGGGYGGFYCFALNP